MEILLQGGSVNPGQEIRIFLQFDNYQYADSKVIRAVPLNHHDSLVTSDLGVEGSIGDNDRDSYYVYSVSVKNIGEFATNFIIISSNKN
jgi:hypothetical protein